MSINSVASSGLGIDLCPATSRNPKINPPIQSRPSFGSTESMDSLRAHATLRSAAAMRGLLLAEEGEGMVKFDIAGGGSGFCQGPRIALESVTPGGGSKQRFRTSDASTSQDSSLSRHGTLLSVGAPPGRNAAELKTILGNSHSRLRPGATLLPPGRPSHTRGNFATSESISLEHAKARARVEVDIVLESNICVQGGYLKGHVQIRIRKRSKKESNILIAGGKLRVIGFECIPNEDDRHTFYQCASPLSAVTHSLKELYTSDPDEDGFALAREGMHTLPFAMLLPLDSNLGNPKGAVHMHSGVTVRYIAMISIEVKAPENGKRSIAHFYRNCEVWPRLDPSTVLAAAPRPLQATISRTLFMGGDGKVKLTATIHRLHWIAGQQCSVKVSVINDTKKTIRSLTLTLIRSTVVFKPNPQLDALPPSHSHEADPDACQTSTSQKEVASTTLEMGQHGSRGHASAKGFFLGVAPGESLDFSHLILIPPSALSVVRGRLLEVEYTIRVGLNAGSLASDVSTVLPIRIINFLSVDPPPSSPLASQQPIHPGQNVRRHTYAAPEVHHNETRHNPPRPVIAQLFAPLDDSSRAHESLANSEIDEIPDVSRRRGGSEDYFTHGASSQDGQIDSDNTQHDSRSHDDYATQNFEEIDYFDSDSDTDLGNLSLHDDSDEVVQYAIHSAKIDPGHLENEPRFSDLYYASVQEGLNQSQSPEALPEVAALDIKKSEPVLHSVNNNRTRTVLPSQARSTPNQRTPVRNDLRPNSRPPSAGRYGPRPGHPRGPSSFAARVQEKLKSVPGEHSPSRSELLHNLGRGESNSTSGSDCSELESYPSSSATSDEELEESVDDYTPTKKSHGVTRDLLNNSQAGSAFSRQDSTGTGSRLLPSPPSMLALPVESLPDSAPSSYDSDVSTPASRVTNERSFRGSTYDVEIKPVRPPLGPIGGGGSASSVKDKIRELEERVKEVDLGY